MIIAIASGKGGTGKTTLSVAMSMASDEKVKLLDCDVEEPNAHIFLDTKDNSTENVYVPIPVVDDSKCTYCGKCAEVCEFNAIANLQNKIMVFDELCHSCGGCTLACPENAITEQPSPIGTITKSTYNDISFVQGKLNIGRAMSPPLIRAVKENIDSSMLNILDCPPGTSCPVITAMNGADFVILVTEDTPFGLHDLSLSVDTIRELGTPFGVVINRIHEDFSEVIDYCTKEKINVLLKIPESMEVAHAYSKGGNLLDAMPQLKGELQNIISEIKESIA